MPKRKIAVLVLKIGWYNDGKGYHVESIGNSQACNAFLDLANALVGYFADNEDIPGYKPEPYKLLITKRARRELGKIGVDVLEHMVHQYNRIVRARKELGDRVDST